MASSIAERLAETARSPRNVSPTDFSWGPNSMGQRSRIGRLRADVPHKLLGRAAEKPVEVAIPTYENLGTTNGTADDQESFGVSTEIVDSPNTDPLVLWLDGEYYGQPDNADYISAGSVDVTDAGTNSTVHAFYIPAKSGTIEVEKATDGSQSKSQNIKTFSLSTLHQRNLSESEVFFEFTNSAQEFEAFIAGDMTLDVYLNAPYVARYQDPDGDGAVATNLLLNFATLQAHSTVPGLKAAVRGEM